MKKSPTLTKMVARLLADLEAGKKLFCDQPSAEQIKDGRGKICFKNFDTTCGGCKMSWWSIKEYFGDWENFGKLPNKVSYSEGYAGREQVIDVFYLKAFAAGILDEVVAKEQQRKAAEAKEKQALLEKEKTEKHMAVALELGKIFPALSTEQALFVAKQLKEVPKAEQIAILDRFLVVAKTSWNTSTNQGSVTDYAVRQTTILDLKECRVAGSKNESHLFRTTEQGVVGSGYKWHIHSVTMTDGGLEVEYSDGTVFVAIK